MDISQTASLIRKFAVDNSPSILTGVAVTGMLSTVVLAVKASFKASEIIQESQIVGDYIADEFVKQTFKDKAKLVWKEYIPATATGVATIACIVGANTISTRRNAALVSVYSITESAFKEYRTKVADTLGAAKEQKVRDDVAKDRMDRNPVSRNEVIITNTGEQLCYDSLSGRYFKSDIETIRRAMNDVNSQINDEGYASQNEFYDLIGLSGTTFSEEVGWTTDNMMKISFSSHLTPEGKPCLSLDYDVSPVRNYYKMG